MKMLFLRLALLFVVLSPMVLAQESLEGALRLPQDPRAWITGTPITTESMRGKAIVLYFFEEGCPRCREKWPAIVAAAKQSRGKPVMLIAVNSGSPPDRLARYVKEQGLDFPVIADVDRSLEKAAGVQAVSLNNIWQARVIDPDGKLQLGDGGDIPGTLESAAASANWNVDPEKFPAEMLPTWQMVEFGNYAGAAKMVTRYSRDGKPAVKSAGEILQAFVVGKLNESVALAEQVAQDGNAWQAFRRYDTIKSEFAGYTLPVAVESEWLRLKNDESIKTEIEAVKLYQTALKIIASGRANPARVKAMKDKIIEKYPGTEAAQLASAMQ